MSNDPTNPRRTDIPVLVRILVPLDWALWTTMAIASIVMLALALTERTRTPEVGIGLGVVVAVLIALLVVAAGMVLVVATRRQSVTGLVMLAILEVWPGALLITRPAVLGYRSWSRSHRDAQVGDFEDPILAAMAGAIEANDTTALARLLGGRPPSTETDRAGNDILAYALIALRDGEGSAAAVRILLEAGADPRKTQVGSGEDVIGFLARRHSHEMHDVIRLLLNYGADPNVVDPVTGNTPLGDVGHDPELVRLLVGHGADIDHLQSNGVPAVVSFIGDRQWESALYLIEMGADLDQANADGLSVDYYLQSWASGVDGERSEGWERVREAIAERRAGTRNTTGDQLTLDPDPLTANVAPAPCTLDNRPRISPPRGGAPRTRPRTAIRRRERVSERDRR